MKKSKLLVLSLLAIGAIGLTSCGEGPKGEKGETGAPGEKGASGDQGTPGKDGENGSSVLNGEGAPKDTLGSDGDSYIDYSSFDYYVKESGKWVKKGNLKGPKGETGEAGEKGETGSKGEKGETGETGSTGSRGNQGNTAWSNTILPSDNGYVTVDKGSTTTGETVKFTVTPNSGFGITSLLLNGESAENNPSVKISVAAEDGSKTYETTMVDNGYVVQAQFYNKTPESGSGNTPVAVDPATGKSYGGLKAALTAGVKEVKLVEETVKVDDNIEIKGESETKIDLNGNTLDLGSESSAVADAETVSPTADTEEVSEVKAKYFKVHGELNIDGKGTIKGDNDVLFEVYGQYYLWNYTNSEVTHSKLLGTAGKLTIGKDVTLSGNYRSFGIYNNQSQDATSTVADGSSTDSSFTANTFKGDENGNAIGYARNAVVNFYGTDATERGFYVNGDIRDKGYYPTKTTGTDGADTWTQNQYNDKASIPQINIKGATIKSNSYVPGYVDLNIEDSTFNVKGTALNILSGDIEIKNSKFNTELGPDKDNYNKPVKIKTPNFIEYDDGAFDGNATIWFADGLKTNAGLTSVSLSGNTFTSKYTELNGNNNSTEVAKWSNVASFVDDENNPKATGVSGSGYAIYKKSSMKGKIVGTFKEKDTNKTLTAYFSDAKTAEEFYEKGADELAKEYGFYDNSDFSGFAFTELWTKTGDTATWAKVEPKTTETSETGESSSEG